MLFERLFIRIGKFFFFTVRPFFTFAILCLPLLCALGAIYLQGTRLEELEERFTVAMRKGKAAFERKDRKERFLVRYLQTDPYFLDQQMESTLFLSQEKQRLEALLPAFPLNTAIQQRYEYIVKYNKLQFTEENIRASSLIKETDEKQRHPIQVNETDLQQLLAIIEDIPVGPYLPPKLGPQFLIRDIRLKKQSTDLQTEILEVEMDLLKREFIK